MQHNLSLLGLLCLGTLCVASEAGFAAPSNSDFPKARADRGSAIAPQAALSPHTLAQVPSPDERFIQPDPNPPQPLDPTTVPIEAEESPNPPSPPSPKPDPGNILVNNIQVLGSSVLSADDLAVLTQPYIGNKVSLDALQTLADAITERYLEAGYITSRAILDEQSIASGNIQIQILEGKVEEIRVEGTERLANYVKRRVELGTATPLRTDRLENQLRLLRADPLFENVEASLRTGTTPTSSILIVRVKESNPFNSGMSLDNYSPPSVGSERFTINGSYRNPTGLGDEVAASFRTTTKGGSRTLEFLYRVPLNPMNGTLQLRTSLNWNDVVQEPFNQFDIRGNSQLYELSFRQPLIRTPREELAVSAGFNYQTGQTFTFAGPTPFGFGPNAQGISTTSVFKLGQDYTRRDVSGAWALRSQFSIGTGLFGATSNPSPVPDSHFFSWLGQIQRVQVLSENNFLIVSADVQLASAGLLPSQQFVMGGGQSVRGFRQNVRAGDNGVRFSIEDRITVERDEGGVARFIFIPFFDMGWVWNASENPNTLPDQRFIAGIGAGIIWQPISRLTIKLDYGIPLVDLSDRSTNAQDDGFYFSVGYQF